MTHKLKLFITSLLIFAMTLTGIITSSQASAASAFSFIILSSYTKELQVGDEFYLIAVSSNSSKLSFSSSSSAIASVNTNGKITAKKTGNAIITVKTKDSEASCKIKVVKTTIKLSSSSLSLENGASAQLTATASTGHSITWKSSKTTIATVDENGLVTAIKPGTAIITAKADDTSVTCNITVKSPTVKISKSSVSLFRKQSIQLNVSSSSKSIPIWKSNKKTVAMVDSNGNVTAVKNGTAIITVTVDGVSKTCEVTVKKPTIRFKQDKFTLAADESVTLEVTVSSGNAPVFSSSNINVATVDENGKITARQPGKTYIYASEDGTKESIIVTVH